MLTYIFMLMTSWAIVCDVYYLDPTSMEVSFIIIKSLNERFESIIMIFYYYYYYYYYYYNYITIILLLLIIIFCHRKMKQPLNLLQESKLIYATKEV